MIRGALVGVVAVLVAVCAVDAQERKKTWEMRVPPKTTPAPIEMEPGVIDVGDIAPGEKGVVRVVIRNTGEEELRIERTRSTCWCAVTELSSKVIEPGGSIEMTGTVEAPDDIGELGRQIFLFFEGYSRAETLEVKGDVNRGVRVRTETTAQPGELLVHMESVDGEAFGVLGVGRTDALGEAGAAPTFADGFDPATDEPRSSYTVLLDGPTDSGGYLNTWFAIETDRADCPVVDINMRNRGVQAGVRPPTAFKSERVYIGAIRAGETVRVSNIAMLPGGDPLYAVERVEGSAGLDARVMGAQKAEEGPEIGFGLTVTRSTPGVFVGEVSVAFGPRQSGSFYVVGRIVE